MLLTVAVCVIVYRDVIFCVLIACHSKESTRLRNIYTAIREFYYCILREGKMSIMLRKMLKKRTYSVPVSIPPGHGTNRLKNGTSRRKRDGWQPYCLKAGDRPKLLLYLLKLLTGVCMEHFGAPESPRYSL